MKSCPVSSAVRLASGKYAGWLLTGFGAAAALTLASGAQAGDKKSAPAPSHPAAAPHFGGASGGGAHMPGSMGGGAHVPGNMSAGAHVPGAMGGGAHIPGSMGGGAHVPGGMSVHRDARTQPQHSQSEASIRHQGGGGGHEAHGAPAREAHADDRAGTRAGEHGVEHGGDREGARAAGHEGERAAGRGGEHGDPRIGGRAAMHTRLAAGVAVGAGAGLAAHHFGEAGRDHDAGLGRDGRDHDFRARPAERDIGRDRAFASAHAHDFHARFVRDFSRDEFGRWRGGDWSAGWHFGRFGWWWDVDGVWYPYAVPIYPFPLEVSAITVYGGDYVEMPALEAAGSIPPLPAAPAALYSCATPSGYYPAVAACGQPWEMADAPPAGPAPN